MVTKEQLKNVSWLLKKGYGFYEACKKAGTSEFSEVGRELGKRRKSISDRKIWEEIKKEQEKEKPVQCNLNCVACSLNCKYRTEEEK